MMPFVKVNRLSRWCLTILVVSLFISIGKTSIAEIMQVHEDFSNDPGWEEVNNRVVASDPPLVNQDFGWSPTGHLDKGQGEIGGTVFQSRTPAWYALPLGRPLTSASLIPDAKVGGRGTQWRFVLPENIRRPSPSGSIR
jgi:hypothetical protein